MTNRISTNTYCGYVSRICCLIANTEKCLLEVRSPREDRATGQEKYLRGMEWISILGLNDL